MLALSPFVSVQIHDFGLIAFHAVAASSLLAMLGLMGGIWADKFDHLAAVTNFIIVPLTFLSGTFYDVKVMVEPFESIAHFNPIFYMIDGYRYGHIGVANGSLQIGVIYTGLLALASTAGVWAMFRNGYKLKA
jgi:ABC-2 type transport system permease protein